jgi:hypothetical protein
MCRIIEVLLYIDIADLPVDEVCYYILTGQQFDEFNGNYIESEF